MRERVRHAVLCLLTTVSLLAPALLTLEMTGVWGQAALCAVAATAVICAASCSGMTVVKAAVAIALTAGATLLAGPDAWRETLVGVVMTVRGVPGALALSESRAVWILSLLAVFYAWALTAIEGGFWCALSLFLAGALMMITKQPPAAYLLLLPGCAAALFLTAMAHQPKVQTRLLLLLLVLAGMCGALVPSGGVTVEPLRELADTVRQRIMDYFFYTQPRDAFSLAQEGYYPQGTEQLGGTAAPTDHPVMTVRTPRKAYLRGVVKDTYTGRVWTDTLAENRRLWISPRWQGERQTLFDETLPQEDIPQNETVQVTMDQDAASTLFVPQRIRGVTLPEELVLYYNRSTEIFATRNLQQGDRYTVQAPLWREGDAGMAGRLARAAARGNPARDREIEQHYTQLPGHLQSEVWQLAREITAGAQTPYKRVQALTAWLKTNCRYSLRVAPQDPSADFVSSFLLITREGYCTYFASALTVLCRMAGLPARYVEGYLAEPDASGTARVTGLNGHAWTEVWFSGFGWLTVDATPASDNPPDSERQSAPPEPQEQPDTPQPPEQTEPQTQNPLEGESPETPEEPPEAQRSRAWLWILLILAALGALGLRLYWIWPGQAERRQRTEMGRWSCWMQAVTDALAVLGETRPASKTLSQWLTDVDRSRAWELELAPLGETAGILFYSHTDPIPDETDMARQGFEDLWQLLDRRQKLRFLLRRAFLRTRSFTK